MVDYGWVQVALLLQMVFWMYLYKWDVKLHGVFQVLFYAAYAVAAGYIILAQPVVGHFTPWLLLQYSVYIMLSVTLLTPRYGFKDALCLGFLVVYLNSFYWELFYHVHEFQIWLPASLWPHWWYLRIPQWLRAVPAWWLGRNFVFRDLRLVSAGLVVSYFLTWLRLGLVWPGTYLHPLHRVICLGVLLKVVAEAEVK